jgi:UDP-2,3-diacylglucosamine pyrophosphatase LpxH
MITKRSLLTQLLIAALMLLTLHAATAPGSERLRIFISDTHLGVGKVDDHWHNYEDARWAPEFAEFLQEMNRVGNGKADLILNGDTFELWQSLDPNDCTVVANKNLGCTQEGALKRLQRVLQFHQPELDAIGKFAKSGDNRVVIVPGNHDAALMFDGVTNAVLKAINAPADRVRVAFEGYWLSPDSMIYAEHGHQIGKEVNKYDGWPQPFLEYHGAKYLQRPWGEQFVQRFYNSFENKYPIIDNLSEDSLGVKYGLKAEGSAAVPQDMGRFVWFYLTQISWSQLSSSLGGPEDHPDWDVPAIRAKGNEFLAESVPQGDAVRDAAKSQAAQGTLGLSIGDLSEDDIIEICNLRKALSDADYSQHRTPTVTVCPLAKLGAITQPLLSSRRKVFQKHFDDTYERLAQANRIERPFQLFVYSHTHKSDRGFRPLAGSSWDPYVVNTGAWQRTVTPDQLAVIQKRHHLDDKNVLTLQPEDLPPCYPVILVPPYPDMPKSKLQFWEKKGASWSLGASCDVF